MNHNQINKTIALSAGWLDIKPSNMGHTFTGFPPGGDLGSRMEIPNYCGPDINPIMRLISRLDIERNNACVVKLINIVMPECFSIGLWASSTKEFKNLSEFGLLHLICFITKSSDRLALAYLKAMNLYDPTIHE